MSLIIGIDGGGTKSTYKVYNTKTQTITNFSGNSINYHSIGINNACDNFKNSIKHIIKTSKIENILSIYAGSAALGIGETPSSNHPFVKAVSDFTKNYAISSDLYIGLKGIDSTPAIFLISGTGSMAIAEDKDGKLFTKGGWGYLIGNQGSGYYIGLEGIKKVIEAYDGFCKKTALQEDLLKYFQITKTEQIINKIFTPNLERKLIAGFAANAIQRAEEDDKIASGIVNISINYLIKHILLLHNKLNKAKCTLAVYGGCFQKSKFFYNLFQNVLNQKRPQIKTGFPKYTSAESALRLGAKLVDIEIEKL